MSDRADVVVVGAGPAGSATAMLLARQGWRVVLVDRAHFPRDKTCAEYMSPGVLDSLQRLGVRGSVDSRNPRPVPGMDIVSRRGNVLRVEYRCGNAALTACTLRRREFDAALLQEAATAGAEVIEGFMARHVLKVDGTVTGVEGEVAGKNRILQGRLTVIADGSRSVLARSLGLAMPPRWPVRMGLVAHYEGEAVLSQGFGQMHVEDRSYCGVAPMPGGLVNVAVVTRADTVRKAGLSASAFLDGWVDGHPRLRAALGDCRRVTQVRGLSPVGSRCRSATTPGALLVGDAASFFDPFTGEGIHRALRGAELAAEIGGAALERSDVSARGLTRYDRERALAFRRKEAVTALVQLFVQYPGLMEYAIPRLANREHPRQTLAMVLGDVCDAQAFLRPRVLWSALRP